MKARLADWGNSLGLRLPRAAAEEMGVKSGDEVDVSVERGELRVRPLRPVPYYRLEDLVGEMERLGPESEPELIDWGPDRGSEIINDAYSRREITLDDILSGRAKDKDAS